MKECNPIIQIAIPIITYIFGILTKWWLERPRLSIIPDDTNNRNMFHPRNDLEAKRQGKVIPLEKVIIRMWFTAAVKGPGTDILDVQLRIFIGGIWSEWIPYSPKIDNLFYDIPFGPALATRDSTLSIIDKQLSVKKNGKVDDIVLYFEFPYLIIENEIKYELMVIPVNGKIHMHSGMIEKYAYKEN